MTGLPSLSKAYAAVLTEASMFDAAAADDARFRSAWGLCRDTSRISLVCEQVLHPWAVSRAPPALIDRAVIEWDLIRVLIHELVQSDPADVLFNALVDVLHRSVIRRFEDDTGADGLIAAALARGVDGTSLDEALGARLRQVADQGASRDWWLLQPCALGSLRSERSTPSSSPRERRRLL